ncbi:MAG: hypothetical protein EBW58_08500, partial [Betaproteobacteria bacterium]|nr:hypothetical protein [Betaproteobacteria bacterium]
NILEALEKLVVGLIRKIDTRSEESRRRIAIHETGHALLCNYFNDYFELNAGNLMIVAKDSGNNPKYGDKYRPEEE